VEPGSDLELVGLSSSQGYSGIHRASLDLVHRSRTFKSSWIHSGYLLLTSGVLRYYGLWRVTVSALDRLRQSFPVTTVTWHPVTPARHLLGQLERRLRGHAER